MTKFFCGYFSVTAVFLVLLSSMLVKTRAIVLHAFKLGETKLVVDMLTEGEGRLSFVIHLPTSSKAKMKKQFFQPLTLLDIECDVRPHVQLHKLRDVRMLEPFLSIPFDAQKLSIALFLAEFLYYCTRDEQQNPALFSYVANSILWLDGCGSSFANFHLVFMMRLSRFVGFYPNIEDYREGDVFDLRAAAFSSTVPLHSDYVGAEDAARIQTLMRMNYDTMHLFRMNHAERNRITDVLLDYYRQHVPNFPELRSLEVVRDLWR